MLGGVVSALRLVAMSPVRRQLTGLRGASDPGDRLTELDRRVRSGAVVPHVDRAFPLDQVVPAVQHMMSGQAQGKIVLTT